LHSLYHKHNRPQKYGYLNNAYTTFESVIPTIKGAKIAIPHCCDERLNLNDYFVTALGNGIVDTANYDLGEEMLELNLMYEDLKTQENCLRPKMFKPLSSTVTHTPPNTYIDIFLLYEPETGAVFNGGEDEITMPSGVIVTQAIDAAQPERIRIQNVVQQTYAQEYKIRRRMRCTDGSYSDWTGYITVSQAAAAVGPVMCGLFVPDSMERVALLPGWIIVFRHPTEIVETIEAKYRIPFTGIQDVIISPIYQVVTGGETVVYYKALHPMVVGISPNWIWNFRRRCSATLTSSWTPSQIISIIP
jgi:hypothetical protein